MRFNLLGGTADFGGSFNPDVLPRHQFINRVSYSRYALGAGDDGDDFVLVWREDFDAPPDGQWSLGTWPSPFEPSVHSPSNLTVVGGKAVVSLTADDALGFSGVPPDPADGAGMPGSVGETGEPASHPSEAPPADGAPTRGRGKQTLARAILIPPAPSRRRGTPTP